MHDVLGVHNLQTFQNALHNHFYLIGSKFMAVFDFVAKLAPL